jgi:hypothetical protein
MGNKWIIDVLADLRAYADLNGLAALADKLEETSAIAKAEISMTPEGAPLAGLSDKNRAGSFSYVARDRGRA